MFQIEFPSLLLRFSRYTNKINNHFIKYIDSSDKDKIETKFVCLENPKKKPQKTNTGN